MKNFPAEFPYRIADAWSAETAMAGHWNEACRANGQCAVTALVVQDILGGEILRAEHPTWGSHYWNKLPGIGEIDLTRAQLPDGIAWFEAPRVVSRESILTGERAERAHTDRRYRQLRRNMGLE